MSKKSYKNTILDVRKLKDDEVGKFAFDIAKQNRDFEISHFWIRATYFSVLIGAVFIGYSSEFKDQEYIKTILSFLGLFLSICWYCANRGSKFWQEHWEAQVEMIGSQLIGKGVFELFVIQGKPCDNRFIFNPLKSYPFSVSKLAILVSLAISALWLAVIFTERVLPANNTYNQIFWLLPIILTVIVPCFLGKSNFAKDILNTNKNFNENPNYYYSSNDCDKCNEKKV